ncbi:putative F-box protein [Cardamine amara subsp. amara]|uniref:F-box protein n=1 Tax=Cardamine amara subsp. amara TaxID=228776 RepID=A0ABD0Z0V2_CARAN
MKRKKQINLEELPPELTSSILLRLGAFEILETAQKVCRSWRRVCKDPSMWRKINIQIPRNIETLKYDTEVICRNAVDRSQGGLLEIDIDGFVTGSLLTYITDRSSYLRSLGLQVCYPMKRKVLVNAVSKLPLLEELEVSYSWTKLNLKAIGYSCPHLKTLKLNCSSYERSRRKFDADTPPPAYWEQTNKHWLRRHS